MPTDEEVRQMDQAVIEYTNTMTINRTTTAVSGGLMTNNIITEEAGNNRGLWYNIQNASTTTTTTLTEALLREFMRDMSFQETNEPRWVTYTGTGGMHTFQQAMNQQYLDMLLYGTSSVHISYSNFYQHKNYSWKEIKLNKNKYQIVIITKSGFKRSKIVYANELLKEEERLSKGIVNNYKEYWENV